MGKSDSDYYAIGTVVIEGELDRMYMESVMGRLRHELIWEGVPLTDGFHASPDFQRVRDRVYGVLQGFQFRFQVTAIEKATLPDDCRGNEGTYAHVWNHHAQLNGELLMADADEIVIIVGSIGSNGRRAQRNLEAVTGALSQYAHRGATIRAVALPDATEFGIQLADYCLWAVMREAEKGDARSRPYVEGFLESESILACEPGCLGGSVTN